MFHQLRQMYYGFFELAVVVNIGFINLVVYYYFDDFCFVFVLFFGFISFILL